MIAIHLSYIVHLVGDVNVIVVVDVGDKHGVAWRIAARPIDVY